MEHDHMHHDHSHGADAPPCTHCIWGHVGPGAYLIWLSAIMFLEAFDAHRLKGRATHVSPIGDRLRVAGGLLVGPTFALGEYLTHKALSWHMGSLQHFTMYAIIFADAIAAFQCRVAQALPPVFIGVWEAGVLTCIGLMMSSHYHGGALVTSMHIMMCPGLMSVAFACVCDRVFFAHTHTHHVPLRLLASTLLLACGLWFGAMGPGFWAYGTHGVLGSPTIGDDPIDAAMQISLLATWDFLISFAVIGGLWSSVANSRR